MVQKLMLHPQFNVGQPVMQIGNREDILDIYLKIIEAACFTMRKDVIQNLDLEEFALQYQMQLKIILARDMLTNSGKSIKEISYDLGFESIHYFSRLFKEKVGTSPSAFCKSHQG